MIRWRLLSLIGLVATVAMAGAAAPASLAGKIFYTSGTTATVGLRAYGASAYQMHADGRLTALYQLSWDITRRTGGWQAPTDGTYTYVRTGNDSSTLTMRVGAFADSSRRLVFTADDHGTIEPPPLVLQNYVFWLGDANAPAPLANVSLRAGAGNGVSTIAGFVVAGQKPRAALVRAVGPGLTGFGVMRVLADPKLSIPNVGPPIDENDNWQTGNNLESMRRIEALTGAFPLAVGSTDAALILPALSPGAYTALVDSVAAASSGEVLIEVYLLP
jgi:hypothetical protein